MSKKDDDKKEEEDETKDEDSVSLTSRNSDDSKLPKRNVALLNLAQVPDKDKKGNEPEKKDDKK